jgi:hypothetical protein
LFTEADHQLTILGTIILFLYPFSKPNMLGEGVGKLPGEEMLFIAKTSATIYIVLY